MDGMSELGTHGWKSGKDSQYQVDLIPQNKKRQCEVHCFVARFLHMHKASSGLCSVLSWAHGLEVDKMTRKSCREMKTALEQALNREWRFLLLIGWKVGSIRKKTKTQTKTLHTHNWSQILEIGKRGVFQAGKQEYGHSHKRTSICKVIAGNKRGSMLFMRWQEGQSQAMQYLYVRE